MCIRDRAWSLTDQAHALGIPVFMKEDLVPIMGDENMIQEMPEEFNKVLEVQRSWQKDVYKRQAAPLPVTPSMCRRT